MPDKTISAWYYGVSAAAVLMFTGVLLAQDDPDEEMLNPEMVVQPVMPQPVPLPNPVPPLLNPVPPLVNPVPPLNNPVPPLMNPVPPIVNPVPPLPNPVSAVPNVVP